MTNVFKQNFGAEFTISAPSFATCFKVVGYSERWLWGMVCWSPFAPLPLPYDDYKVEPKRHVSHKTIHLSEGTIKTQDISSFLCASS